MYFAIVGTSTGPLTYTVPSQEGNQIRATVLQGTPGSFLKVENIIEEGIFRRHDERIGNVVSL